MKPQRQYLPEVPSGDRIPVRLETNRSFKRDDDLLARANVRRGRRDEWGKKRPLAFEPLISGFAERPDWLFVDLFKPLIHRRVKVIDAREVHGSGHRQKVVSKIPDESFDLALCLGPPDLAPLWLKAALRGERKKRGMNFPDPASIEPCGFHVVVQDFADDACEMLKRLDMTREQRRAFHVGRETDVCSARIAKEHDERVYLPRNAVDFPYARLFPVDLGLLCWHRLESDNSPFDDFVADLFCAYPEDGHSARIALRNELFSEYNQIVIRCLVDSSRDVFMIGIEQALFRGRLHSRLRLEVVADHSVAYPGHFGYLPLFVSCLSQDFRLVHFHLPGVYGRAPFADCR